MTKVEFSIVLGGDFFLAVRDAYKYKDKSIIFF
jgi:hypothetical protein